MRFPVILLTLIAATSLGSHADDTTRRGPLRTRPGIYDVTRPAEAAPDTIDLMPDNIEPTGFDKTLRANRESLFLTNNTALTLSAVELTIDYTDLSDRELHSRTLWVECDIPPGATRRVDFPTWDRQHTFYYYKGPQPRTPRTTPFKVRVTATRAETGR